MSKKAPPFDPVAAAVAVRAREISLQTLKPEEQALVRRELSHTGRLRTKLLRGKRSDPGTVTRTSHTGGFFS